MYVLYTCACVCKYVLYAWESVYTCACVYSCVEVGESNSAFLLNSLRQSLSEIQSSLYDSSAPGNPSLPSEAGTRALLSPHPAFYVDSVDQIPGQACTASALTS